VERLDVLPDAVGVVREVGNGKKKRAVLEGRLGLGQAPGKLGVAVERLLARHDLFAVLEPARGFREDNVETTDVGPPRVCLRWKLRPRHEKLLIRQDIPCLIEGLRESGTTPVHTHSFVCSRDKADPIGSPSSRWNHRTAQSRSAGRSPVVDHPGAGGDTDG
jgi:hypothetical protein